MNVNTIAVEAVSTQRDKKTLDQKIEETVADFLDSKKGDLEKYDLSGTVLDQAGFGRSLVTIYWEPKAEPKKEEAKKEEAKKAEK